MLNALYKKYISTHTPAWGATIPDGVDLSFGVNFNSHARVGRDNLGGEMDTAAKISTHTPAWGATVIMDKTPTETKISTHTPAWGATLQDIVTENGKIISTHTPAWGATHIHCISTVFN